MHYKDKSLTRTTSTDCIPYTGTVKLYAYSERAHYSLQEPALHLLSTLYSFYI